MARDEDGLPKITARRLRHDVMEQLGKLPAAHIAYLATKLEEAFPETKHYLLEAREAVLPEKITEAEMWPLIVRRMAVLALSADPKAASVGAQFFAKIYRKDGGKGKGGAEDDSKTTEERLRDMVRETMTELGHEPGAAIAVDTGIK